MSLNPSDRGILNLDSADEIRKLPSIGYLHQRISKKAVLSASTMLFHFKTSLILPVALIIVTARLVVCIPYHGLEEFLGHSYWTQRYPSLRYTEWDGFWNNYYSGRKEYKRSSTETSAVSCGGCYCDEDEQELECRGSPLTL